MSSTPVAAREGATSALARVASLPAAGITNGRRLVWLLILVVALAVTCLASLAVGARSIPLPTVVDALVHFDPGNGDHAVVHSRLVRTAVALVVGMSLGLAGTSMQGVARNPLADPGILGVNAGASLAVVTGIFFFGATSVSSYLWFAFIGSAVAAVVVYAVATALPMNANHR